MIEQAVILTDLYAAGAGGNPPGPDRVLLGLTLLERAILALGYGGIRRILVLGREAGRSRSFRLEEDDRLKRSGVTLQWAAAGDPGAALPLPHAPFLLLGGTVVFTSALGAFVNGLRPVGDLILAAPGNETPGFCGLAVCRAEMFPRLLALPGDNIRVEDLNALFTPAGAEARLVADHSWVWVNSRQTEWRARHLLRRSMGKPSDGYFSRHLNRHVSWPLSRWLIRLHVRPNSVTWANLALGLLSGWLIGRGGYGPTLAAGLLFQFVSIFDGCDGEIARLTFRFSNFGTRLDNLCDMVVVVVFFLNLPIGLYAATANVFYFILEGLAALFVAVFYLLLLALVRVSKLRGNTATFIREVQDRGKNGEALGWIDRLAARLGFIYRKEFVSLYAMAWCLFNLAAGLVWSIVVMMPLGIVFLAYSIWRLKNEPVPGATQGG